MATSITNKESEVDQANFRRAGFITGTIVESMLEVPFARFVKPTHLALIGLSVFASEEFTIVKPADLELAVQQATDAYQSIDLAKYGTTFPKLRDRYKALIGEEDYSKGEIAKAIRQISNTGEDYTGEKIKRTFATLMAYFLKCHPSFIPEPGVELDYNFLYLNGIQHELDLLKQPEIMVEYGPGISGTRRIPREIRQIGQTICIDKNAYTAQILTGLATLYNFKSPQFTVENSSIGQASEKLLNTDIAGHIDIIVASQVYSAGSREIIRGIQNGKKLLRTGGTFAVLTRLKVEPTEMQGEEMLQACRETFGEEEIFYPFTYMTMASRQQVEAFYAIFKNP